MTPTREVGATHANTRDAGQAVRDARAMLQSALRTASAVECLTLLPLIERAATLARDIGALAEAMAQDAKGDA